MANLYDDFVVDDITDVDTDCPEHELLRAILRQALNEATYRKVIVSFHSDHGTKSTIKFARGHDAIMYLTKKTDDITSVDHICETIGKKYSLIQKLINKKPHEYESFTEIKINCYRGRNGWLIKDDYKLKNFGICIDVNEIYETIFTGVV